jgi:hypothetical protein
MPSALTRVQEDWGLASYDPDAGTFGFAKLGERLRAHAILDVKGAVYVEALAYGPLRMGMVDFASGWRSDLFEARGHLRILDSKQPICAVIGSDQRSLLRNIREGAQAEFPTGTAYARTPMGILAWWPREQPIGAALLDPKRMERLATWSGRPAVDASKQPAATPARSRA